MILLQGALDQRGEGGRRRPHSSAHPAAIHRDRPRRAREHEADRDSLKNPISPAVTRAGVHAPVNLSLPARYAGAGRVPTGILRVLPRKLIGSIRAWIFI